jgi:hypothetical protein
MFPVFTRGKAGPLLANYQVRAAQMAREGGVIHQGDVLRAGSRANLRVARPGLFSEHSGDDCDEDADNGKQRDTADDLLVGHCGTM